ncbi:MAG: hypothetical protein ABI045_00735 [Flavobacteriales bacterium]
MGIISRNDIYCTQRFVDGILALFQTYKEMSSDIKEFVLPILQEVLIAEQKLP